MGRGVAPPRPGAESVETQPLKGDHMTIFVVLCTRKYTTTAAWLSIIEKTFVKKWFLFTRKWLLCSKCVAAIVVLAKDLFDLFLG